MMSKNDNTISESGAGKNFGTLHDEISAATEELKAAQAKLDAAKAKLELQEAAFSQGESVVASAASPIELKAEAVIEGVNSEEVFAGEPNWTSYTSDSSVNQAAAAYMPQEATGQGSDPEVSTPPPNPYVQQPYYTTYNTVPPQTPQPQQQYYYYQQQQVQPMVVTKDHVSAGLLGIFLGWLGIHKFYLGYNTAGFIMLAVTILGSVVTMGIAGVVIALIGFLEGIIYLVKSQSDFERLYVFNKREWF